MGTENGTPLTLILAFQLTFCAVLTERQERPQFLFPHNAPRAPGMDPGCWEMKWEHRDDCVNALMARNIYATAERV